MKQTIRKLIYPKLCTISPENKSLGKETPEELFPEGKLIDIVASVSKTRLERERFVNAKDKISQKRKTKEKQVAAHKEAIPMKRAII